MIKQRQMAESTAFMQQSQQSALCSIAESPAEAACNGVFATLLQINTQGRRHPP
jgi:hypothetical protein